MGVSLKLSAPNSLIGRRRCSIFEEESTASSKAERAITKIPAATSRCSLSFFFQAEDGIRDLTVTGVQTCALPISMLFTQTRTLPCLVSGALGALALIGAASRAQATSIVDPVGDFIPSFVDNHDADLDRKSVV